MNPRAASRTPGSLRALPLLLLGGLCSGCVLDWDRPFGDGGPARDLAAEAPGPDSSGDHDPDAAFCKHCGSALIVQNSKTKGMG